jgi:SAM-dependent methyltransferase
MKVFDVLKSFYTQRKVNDAKIYWQNLTIPARNAHIIYEKVMQFRDPQSLSSVLELGCASGGNLKYFMDRIPAINTVGIEVNECVLSLAGKYPTFRGIVGDEQNLRQFSSKNFDVAFTLSVLDHLPDESIVEWTISELIRISNMTLLLEPFIEGIHGDVSGKTRGEVKKGLERPDKKFARHSYVWNYDRMLDKMKVPWTKKPLRLHAASLGPFYHLYVINVPSDDGKTGRTQL